MACETGAEPRHTFRTHSYRPFQQTGRSAGGKGYTLGASLPYPWIQSSLVHVEIHVGLPSGTPSPVLSQYFRGHQDRKGPPPRPFRHRPYPARPALFFKRLPHKRACFNQPSVQLDIPAPRTDFISGGLACRALPKKSIPVCGSSPARPQELQGTDILTI